MRALVLFATLFACSRPTRAPSVCADLERCKKACDEGAARACRELGRLHLRGEPPGFDLAAAARAYERACDRGDLVGCAALGLQAQDGRGVPFDPDRAARLYARACDGGVGVGCFNLGLMHASGNGVTLDRARAEALFKDAEPRYRTVCEGDDPSWCANLGILHEQGMLDGTPRPERAAEIYRKACDRRDPDSCVNLALLELEARGVPRDVETGQKRLVATCDTGWPLACGVLGQLFLRENDFGVARDVARGVPLLERACAGGEKQPCALLGALHGIGEGVPVDRDKADALFARACDLGDSEACTTMGNLFLSVGKGAEGADALERGCHVGSGEACVRAAAFLELGRGIQRDAARATALLRHGCRMMVLDACVGLVYRGEPLPLPPDEQAKFLGAACERGFDVACAPPAPPAPAPPAPAPP